MFHHTQDRVLCACYVGDIRQIGVPDEMFRYGPGTPVFQLSTQYLDLVVMLADGVGDEGLSYCHLPFHCIQAVVSVSISRLHQPT